MALSTNLAAAKAALDTITNDTHPTVYNRPEITKLVEAMNKIILDVDLLNNA